MIVDKIISRESFAHTNAAAHMTVGRDGNVYLTSSTGGTVGSCVLRVAADGSSRAAVEEAQVYYLTSAANAAGRFAASVVHFAAELKIYNADFTLRARTPPGTFLTPDPTQVNYDAPRLVEAGASGDFYALDQYRTRIVRVTENGVVAGTIPHTLNPAAGELNSVTEARVSEAASRVYLAYRDGTTTSVIVCTNLSGVEQWRIPSSAGYVAGWDADDDGNLYFILSGTTVVRQYDSAGNEVAFYPLTATWEELNPQHFRVRLGQLYVKRPGQDVEMFRVYTLGTGAFVRVVEIEHEHMIVTAADDPWTAGTQVSFTLTHAETLGQDVNAACRAYARPFGSVAYERLTWSGTQLTIPAGYAGVYHLKVVNSARPVTDEYSEYLLNLSVEVRTAGAVGSCNVYTTGNRTGYAAGEPIPFTVAFKGAAAAWVVNLVDSSAAVFATFSGSAGGTFEVAQNVTANLRPGRYRLLPVCAGKTCVAQVIDVGPVIVTPAMDRVQFTDYGFYWTDAAPHRLFDASSIRAGRMASVGTTLAIDHAGAFPTYAVDVRGDLTDPGLVTLVARLTADANAVSERKADYPPPLQVQLDQHTIVGSTRRMAVLTGNDAGVPAGTGFDARNQAALEASVLDTTDKIGGRHSFTGWSYQANFWSWGPGPAGRYFLDGAEEAAYNAAVAAAHASGTWAAVIGTVNDRVLTAVVDMFEGLNDVLDAEYPNLVRASGMPFRGPHGWPPVTSAPLEATDGQTQWEQIRLPFDYPFGTDFYQRPGKRHTPHPELWNDYGTGGQIVPCLTQTIARGSTAIGSTLDPLPSGPWTDDPRAAYHCGVGVYRALNRLAWLYGPLFAVLDPPRDRVAMVLSKRQFDLEWTSGSRWLFGQWVEAYASLCYAGACPKIVFPEEAGGVDWDDFDAAVVVGQTVQPEAAVITALDAAEAAGADVYYDGTSRASLFSGKPYSALGVSFDQFDVIDDSDGHNSDSGTRRMIRAVQTHGDALRPLLGPPPGVSSSDDPDAWVTERPAGEGVYVFVTNQKYVVDLEPACMWKAGLYCASGRVPFKPSITLPAGVVYDLLDMEVRTPVSGAVTADLVDAPMRIYAVLPELMGAVSIDYSPASEGQPFEYQVRVLGASGNTLRVPVPVVVRLVDDNGVVTEEPTVTSPEGSASGRMVWHRGLRNPTLSATELLGGAGSAVRLRCKGVAACRTPT